jgi:hypothetical protein
MRKAGPGPGNLESEAEARCGVAQSYRRPEALGKSEGLRIRLSREKLLTYVTCCIGL